MGYDILKYVFFIWLLIGGYACVPTDTGVHNPNEKIYCDIATQLNGNDKSVKSEVRFYVKDEDSRPYFLEEDVEMNGKVMKKKFMEHKGIYYSLLHSIDGDEGLTLSFTNLDDVKYDVKVPLELVNIKARKKMSMKDFRQEKLNGEESLLLIDAKGKIFDIKKSKVINEVTLGKGQLIKTVTKDSLYQLKDKLWLKYNTKSLSATQFIDLVE
ncbi:MAG: hypothetical protein ACI94Y_002067 [Maribacter sp.]|jgi:hypothetical protein